MKNFREMVIQNRSYRRFDETHRITRETLVELIGLARCTASAANLQPLKYILSYEKGTNDLVFPCLAWAGYLKDWDGPAPGERPTAYVVILHDETITKNVGCDHGISAQTILLGAVERGLGGCMIGSVKKDFLREKLDIPDHLKILLVIALGKPAEKVVLEDVKPGGDIKYWRDENSVHHVPKRTLDELIIGG
ncbi:MAG: nitroreductase family protein [Deltaproteobacteria bacterium]|nr:nitroreductase family protein [Deltaproteobacteria bacterium]